jgi:hypothetical protein
VQNPEGVGKVDESQEPGFLSLSLDSELGSKHDEKYVRALSTEVTGI